MSTIHDRTSDGHEYIACGGPDPIPDEVIVISEPIESEDQPSKTNYEDQSEQGETDDSPVAIACPGPVVHYYIATTLPPNTVFEVQQDEYSDHHVCHRNRGMILYSLDESLQNEYVIVLHHPFEDTMHQAFTLFRADNFQVAKAQFTIYKNKVPTLVQMCKELYNPKDIQKLCDTLSNHPSWTLAHVAAHLNLFDVLRQAAVLAELNSGDSTTGISPLQVAIQSNNLQMVQQLIDAKASFKHLDHNGNSVYHYAAVTTEDIILALGGGLSDVLNNHNNNGHTPLHIACLNDKPDCIKALLVIGADVNMSATEGTNESSNRGDSMSNETDSLSIQDIKCGGTPLHCSSSCEAVDALIKMNCNIDALNADGQTALHIMVMRKRLDCVASLLSHMASINIADNEGNTPLHLAARKDGLLSILQLLIGFGADINAKNNANETPRHLIDIESDDGKKILYALQAVGAKRCESNMEGCTVGCKFDEIFYGDASSEICPSFAKAVLSQILHAVSVSRIATQGNKKIKGGRLLCLDGGGMRGLVLIQTLMAIEAALKKPILSCFDWVAGSSTGGILGLLLATGKTLIESQAIYFRIKQNIFVGSKPYNSENLENFFKDCLGADTVMADIKPFKLMITGVLADRKPVDLHLFRNYQSPSSLLKVPLSGPFKPTLPADEQLLWKVARATGAAPTYFKPFGRFLDGSVIANNPTLDAMKEMHEYNTVLKLLKRKQEVAHVSLVVSLGTGAESVIPLGHETYVSELDHVLLDAAAAVDGCVVERARTWCSTIGVPYYRFNPPLSAEVPCDEQNDEVLADMIWTTKAFMHANREQVKELAALLARDH